MTPEIVEANLQGIKSQLERFLDFDSGDSSAIIDNNARWLCEMSAVDFMRDTGKYFTVNYMLSKESVKRRIGSEEGLSYTEFSYMLLQAHDFLVLNDRYDCVLQIGGSDQWGNILSGADLIRRVRSKRAHGLVFPLVTSSSGAKFGKTEAGTVWLDPERTSPYKFYQFWLNTDDRDVVKYLKFFTWLGREEITELEEEVVTNPGRRQAQKKLAEEVTRQVHGESELQKAIQASAILFGGDMSALNLRDVKEIFEDVPSQEMGKNLFAGDGITIVDLLADAGVTTSRGEARRLLKGGGVRLNNVQIDESRMVTAHDAIDEQVLVLRKGKKNYYLIEIS
jgi:tyrosyl-tRNA synthetase